MPKFEEFQLIWLGAAAFAYTAIDYTTLNFRGE